MRSGPAANGEVKQANTSSQQTRELKKTPDLVVRRDAADFD
jgi:hypothetical protein